jgi:hypothetical protein
MSGQSVDMSGVNEHDPVVQGTASPSVSRQHIVSSTLSSASDRGFGPVISGAATQRHTSLTSDRAETIPHFDVSSSAGAIQSTTSTLDLSGMVHGSSRTQVEGSE